MSVADGGYAGAVALADGRVILAAAVERELVHHTGNVAAAVRTIFAANGWDGWLPKEPPSYRGTPQLTRDLVRPAAERLFVIGDAAGYVEPFTGEGMATAFKTATAVVPFVLRGVERWRPNLACDWAREYRRLIVSRRIWCRTFATLLRYPRLTRVAVSAASRWPKLPRALAQQVIGERLHESTASRTKPEAVLP
jgi:flavin-dependent dehydrogenase